MTVTQSVRDEILRHPGPTLIESGVDTAGPVASPVVRARVPTTGALDRRTSMNGVALAAGDAAALWLLLGLTLTPALGGQGGHAWQTVFICTWVIASLTFRSYPGYGMDSSGAICPIMFKSVYMGPDDARRWIAKAWLIYLPGIFHAGR